jgi:ADP-heptose:LPS heptosyltransferase/GT2 family glycosyltransferase
MQVKGVPAIRANISSILLIQLGDIGDVVLSFPAIRALRENFPDARLMVAVREKACELIVDCPWASGVISINQEKRSPLAEIRYQTSFFKHLRQFPFDLSVNLKPGDRSSILSFLAGARQRICFYAHDGQLWQNRVSTHLNLLDYQVGDYVADYYSSLLAAYNIETAHPLPELQVPSEKLKAVERLLRAEGIPSCLPIIAVQPFSLWQYKEWETDKYVELIRQIGMKYGFPVIVTGTSGERGRASAIVNACGNGVFNLAGKTSVGMLAALLKACALFIGVDSAGLHIAAAVGTPTVSIFGPSSAASWAPRGPRHVVVHPDLPCVPCRQKGCEGTERSRCLESLTVPEVMAAVAAQIAKLSNGPMKAAGCKPGADAEQVRAIGMELKTMNRQPGVSRILIGIPVLNNVEMTRACLHCLVRNTPLDERPLDISLLVLDNGSKEDIAGLLRDEFSNAPFLIHYRRNPRNMGVAVAWNQILAFWPDPIPGVGFRYDYYVISNNDALFGPDWLQPMIEAMESDARIGWVSAMENGSPVAEELIEAHTLSRQYRVDPSQPFTTEAIHESVKQVYASWGGHEAFCQMIRSRGLPLFVPFRKEGRSAVCFMIRPAMVAELGFFDEDMAPIGIAEDLEYFLRMEQILRPTWLTVESYPPARKWRSGFCGRSVVHHNWCSTRQGPSFDGRKWDKMREKNWKAKFGKSKKYYSSLLP